MNIIEKDNIDIAPGSDGFWYNLTMGGYVNPSDLMSDPNQIFMVEQAINLVRDLEMVYDKHCPEY